jgi:ABC-type multidrug transport system ATPase subunit
LILDEPANDSTPPASARFASCRAVWRDAVRRVRPSHLLAEIELMCDRVAIIHNGALLRRARSVI